MMSAEREGQMPISSEGDMVLARKTVRTVVTGLGFGVTDVTRVVTAVSELARNVYRYAGSGTMAWQIVNRGAEMGVEFVFEDQGPGIPDVERAMEPGYSTGGGLGMGLPGAKRLMDELEIISEAGKGARVTVRKWLRRS